MRSETYLARGVSSVNDDTLSTALVPAQTELGHVKLHRQELLRTHVIKVSVHLIFIIAYYIKFTLGIKVVVALLPFIVLCSRLQTRMSFLSMKGVQSQSSLFLP